jgi:hypothetical protein
MATKDGIELSAMLDEVEIRLVKFRFPGCTVEGFQWRYRVTTPPKGSSDPKAEWTRWIFGSRPSVEAMIEKFQQYLREDSGPGTQVQ